MKKITPVLPEAFTENGITKDNFLQGDGLDINSFNDLRKIVAELSCLHPDSIVFFRGQHTDHKRKYSNKGIEGSTFLPSIYRGQPTKQILRQRWQRLELATNLLKKEIKKIPKSESDEFSFLKDKRLAQWSVLQHYGIVETPLLDVTQSLRVACSFADLGRDPQSSIAYIYAFALPYPTGRISINSEHDITNIRLLSVIPSIVRRPHNQEGFLVGEDDIAETEHVSEKFDLRMRAIAKFRIHIGEDDFWKTYNNQKDRPLTEEELYPDKNDQDKDILYTITERIKSELNTYQNKDTKNKLETFIDLWNNVEYYLLGYQREMGQDLTPSVSKAIKTMTSRNTKNSNPVQKELIMDLKHLSTIRNTTVHYSQDSPNLETGIFLARKVIDRMEKELPGIRDMAKFYISDRKNYENQLRKKQ